MRSHRIVAVAAAVGAVVVLSWSATPGAQGRGRANATASEPTPKLADGTVNLGRVAGEKGYWNTPYITNMGARVIDPSTGKPFPLVEPAGARGGRGGRGSDVNPVGGGEGGGGGGRGGAAAEPFVPFQPWAAAVYNYNTLNNVLHTQAAFNDHVLKTDDLYYELVHNVVVELTRSTIELKNLKMRSSVLRACRVLFSIALACMKQCSAE